MHLDLLPGTVVEVTDTQDPWYGHVGIVCGTRAATAFLAGKTFPPNKGGGWAVLVERLTVIDTETQPIPRRELAQGATVTVDPEFAEHPFAGYRGNVQRNAVAGVVCYVGGPDFPTSERGGFPILRRHLIVEGDVQ